jgi:RimJ/RimL family protein N-acetyltransferase
MAHPTVGPGIPTLTTERLRLRSFRKSDLDDYAALSADREVLRYLGAGTEPWDRGRSSRHLAFLLGHWQLWDAGTWAVEHKESGGAFVGMVGFSSPEGWPGFELAWVTSLSKVSAGNRCPRRAPLGSWIRDLGRPCRHGPRVHRLEEGARIISLFAPENRASIRVAERIGELPEDRIIHFGREMLCYGLDRATYLGEVAPAMGAMALCAG